ncbi:MAG TPA: alpha-L-rhamnosidase C-terminal domain-containing protein, partial [Verrucomicrobiae bacterium]|nr:alpha-L-rhamnosidase C-terminal domain-containing protein [Verrucomicrobiae bacterium]
YQTILIKPVIGEGLTWANTTYNSIHGPIGTYWKKEGKRLELAVTIPANTTATVFIPTGPGARLTESGQAINRAPGVHLLRHEPGRSVVAVESGNYYFTCE